MALSGTDPRSAVLTATLCAGAVSAQFIAGKATRDALYLANLEVTSLPTMVIATAGVSILLVALSTRVLRSVRPGVFVPIAFAANALLLMAAWLVSARAPAIAAQAVYLQVSGLGPMLGSGFWLIATERFDPHTARHQFGRIAGIGTLSGLAGALVTERIAALYGASMMLPLLAVVNIVCAWQVRRLAGAEPARRSNTVDGAPDLVVESPRSGLRVLSEQPYLQNLAVLVLLGTVSATLVDYVFKVQAVETLGRGDSLLRFFAIYYAATSLLAFVVQTSASSLVLEKLGLAVTAGTPSFALLGGGLGAMLFPGLQGTMVARAGESVFRGSLFRTGYEIFYTPIPSAEKRAAKSIIDVGCDRLGDAVGGGLIRLLLLLPAASQHTAILSGAVACSGVAIIVARRLSEGYIQTLARSLMHRAVELDLSDAADLTTRTTILRTLPHTQFGPTPQRDTPSGLAERAADSRVAPTDAALMDPAVQDILALRSRNRDQILGVLRRDDTMAAALVPHVIPLLAWDVVSEDAVKALRKVAEERVGELVDALIDPNQPFAVRRRLARVFSVCVSQRAVDGVMLGLDDQRFEVRFQCGRSLAAIAEKNALVKVDRERVFNVVRREVAVGRPVWESHRVLDRLDDQPHPLVDEFLKDRASQSLAHVFTLLSLVFPATPLQIAYRGLHTDDAVLRGTALEYLEGVLPPDIRDRLRPFLGERAADARDHRPQEQILADLLGSRDSIMLNLEELRRKSSAAV